MPSFISEDQIEQALLQRLQHQHGYDVLNCYTSDPEEINDGSNRADKRDVVFTDRLKSAASRLNPEVPESAIDDALARLLEKRQAMSSVAANHEVDTLVRDGIPVQFENKQGRTEDERVRLIDFQNPENNEFLAVSQMWVKGERGHRRPDVLLYVNGIPLVFIELKNSNESSTPGLRRALRSLLRRQAKNYWPKPPIHRRGQSLRRLPQPQKERRKTWRLLAHARIGQELLDDFSGP